MQKRSKIVELFGSKFQVRKLPPDAGSFIFMRMLGLSMRMQAEEPETSKKEEPEESVDVVPQPQLDGETRVRALVFGVFSNGASFADVKFIQDQCMLSAAIIQERQGVDFPLPIIKKDGTWTPEGEVVADNFALLMQLTTEVLVLCFADFFEASSPGL